MDAAVKGSVKGEVKVEVGCSQEASYITGEIDGLTGGLGRVRIPYGTPTNSISYWILASGVSNICPIYHLGFALT